jgi:hypothetical protein
MNRRVIYSLSALVFLFGASKNLLAQSQEQIDKFNKERSAYFTEKLELSDAESKAFWPLYEDFFNRKMKLIEDERNIWSYAHKNADNLSDKEILETLEKGYVLKEKQLALEMEYYQEKFLKALPAKKVLQLGKVEWDFRKHLLRELRGKDQSHGNQGKGAGNGPEGREQTPSMPDPCFF